MSVEKLTTIYSQHTVFLQRVGAGHGLAVTPYLERIQEAMTLIFLRNSGKNSTQARMVRIRQQINEVTRKELQEYISWLKVQNREVGDNESSFAASSLDSVVKSDVDIDTPSSAQVNALAVASPIQMGEKSWTTYNTMMKNYWEKYTDEIDSIVAVGFASGQTIEQMSRDIMNQIVLTSSDSTGNVLTRARKSAKSLAITGTNHYANQARIAFVDQNDELLTGYRLIAVVDSRTSQKCRALDQKVIKKDNPKLANFTPPLHRNCRTAMVYEVDQRFRLDDSETQRASAFEVDGKRDPKPISSEGIYYDKMSKLNNADQDNILGPTLGKAFRKLDNPEAFAKATIDRLGNPLSIKEMKSRDNQLAKILNGI
mgnify:CR=1 FL=1